MPFHDSRRNGILYLTLDTPGSEVNVICRATAMQLESCMRRVSPADTGAVVIRSAKTNSFVNGAQLMLAQAARNEDSAARLTEGIAAAYQSLREAHVPVVAAVEGNCYGCGLELLLHCKYRIASETQETHFRMTEIADYLLIPVFRGTQHLPEQVGLANAIDLLLWGEKWNTGRALAEGLINEVVPARVFESEVDGFVERVIAGQVRHCFSATQIGRVADHAEAGGRRNCYSAELKRETEARIESLPSAYRSLYRECLDLLVRAAAGERGPNHHARELASAARTASMEISKAAAGFFYIRQMAAMLPSLKTPLRKVSTIRAAPSSRFGRDLGSELEERIVPGVQVMRAGSDEAADPESTITLSDMEEKPQSPNQFGVQLGFHDTPPDLPDRVLYSPLFRSGSQLFEIAIRVEGDAAVSALAQYLTKAGFTVVLSKPQRALGFDQMLSAFLLPIADYIAGGGSAGGAAGSLREFGFIRGPRQLWNAVRQAGPLSQEIACPRRATALESLRQVDAEESGLDSLVPDAVCLSLLTCTPASSKAAFFHPVLADLAARELLDFPLGRGSLCRYLTKPTVARMLTRGSAIEALVSNEALAVAENFVRSGKEFYR